MTSSVFLEEIVMKKNLLIAFVLIFGSLAFAETTVGTYVIQIQDQTRPDGTTLHREIKSSVLSLSADGTMLSMRNELQDSGEIHDVVDIPIGSEDGEIMMAEDGAVVLANCVDQGGTLETITVPAGTFDTCKFILDDAKSKGAIWVGAVPFGWVKQEILWIPTGNTNIFVLKEIGIAQPES